ncbi:hypothetical protein ACFYM2_21385 [Streptomyces sp. NPDC006711]|uniref:hypothetical protein n=1 Tax=Streptomyces sp. NPDC006711 TaxID=3364762 RepID=UPI0036B76DB4
MNDYEQHADEEREYPTAAEEKAAEIALDMADEARFAAEEAKRLQVTPDDHECQAEFIDGTLDYCGCDDCNDREAAEEWEL